MSSLFKLERLEKIWGKDDNAAFILLFPDKKYNWEEFISSVKLLSAKLYNHQSDTWLLYTDEPCDFIKYFLALIYAGKNIVLPGVSPKALDGASFPILSNNKEISFFNEEELKNQDYNFKNIFNSEKQVIMLQTSGSTGESKNVIKTFNQIEAELEVLQEKWFEEIDGSVIYSTVSHQHFYGLLFSILLPLAYGVTIYAKRLLYPETLLSIKKDKVTLITSPAFLKRLTSLNSDCFQDRIISIFSSGGFLPEQVSLFCERFFNKQIIEIYGSTETGGIAFKVSPADIFWTPFKCVNIKVMDENIFVLQSPYLYNNSDFVLEDKLEMCHDNKFRLLGRNDSVVKVEEKRVALNDIENRILETGFVNDVIVILLEKNRQFIATVIELNEKGKEFFLGNKKIEINKYFRDFLGNYFHPTVLPKKWVYTNSIPRNSQGKALRNKIMSFFTNTNIIDNPEILSKENINNNWQFLLRFPSNYRYFDGHFPEMKILPAVAQINWILLELSKEMRKKVVIRNIPRIKFMNPIFPEKNVKVVFNYSEEKKVINFEFINPDDESYFSKGKIFLKESF